MYSIQSEITFNSAHFLQNYKGKCSTIHGHNWKVIAEVQSEKLHNDMVKDFKELKNYLKEIEKLFDHKLIIKKDSLKDNTIQCLKDEGFELAIVDFNTTAENFAKHIYYILKNKYNLNVRKVNIYETENNKASYWEGN